MLGPIKVTLKNQYWCVLENTITSKIKMHYHYKIWMAVLMNQLEKVQLLKCGHIPFSS